MNVSVVVGGVAYENFEKANLISLLGESAVMNALSEQALQDAQAARSAAYRRESDPLYLEWQYDQTPEAEQVWRDKVAEIKARYPLPA